MEHIKRIFKKDIIKGKKKQIKSVYARRAMSTLGNSTQKTAQTSVAAVCVPIILHV